MKISSAWELTMRDWTHPNCIKWMFFLVPVNFIFKLFEEEPVHDEDAVIDGCESERFYDSSHRYCRGGLEKTLDTSHTSFGV